MNKVKETIDILKRFYPDKNFLVEPVSEDVSIIEIQGNDLEEIAIYSLREALKRIRDPDKWDIIIREDAGLFIESLRGFPGPYSSYVYKTIGIEGVLRLMKDTPNKKAYFKSVIAFKIRGSEEIRVARGFVYGYISDEIRGSRGFGFDPIFIPEGYDKTFGELGLEIKNMISHRSKALTQVINYFLYENRSKERARGGV